MEILLHVKTKAKLKKKFPFKIVSFSSDNKSAFHNNYYFVRFRIVMYKCIGICKDANGIAKVALLMLKSMRAFQGTSTR